MYPTILAKTGQKINRRKVIDSGSDKQTKQIAFAVAKKIRLPAIICLYGDLGSGKTVFTKGFAQGLGIPGENIKSPTYTFVREYKHRKIHFFHFDFYRVENLDDLMVHDVQEILQKKNVCVIIEWAERISSILPKNTRKIFFEYIDEKTRRIIFE